MNRIIRRILGTAVPVLLLLATLASPVFAQTTLNSTTTSAAITTDRQTVIRLTSVTSIAVNDWLFVDAEAMQVNAIDTVTLFATVRRGIQGTAAKPHASGAVVYSGVASRFYVSDAAGGVCTATSEEFLPHINLRTGNIFQCSNSEWVLYRRNGFRETMLGRNDGGTTYTVLGAITIQPGLTFINGTTLAMTLANPTVEQNGMVMIILSTNASAHTVTYTAGFGGGTTARDVATFGGAINDGFTIVAFNGIWWVLSTRNVTLG